jgi:hypothetical protein
MTDLSLCPIRSQRSLTKPDQGHCELCLSMDNQRDKGRVSVTGCSECAIGQIPATDLSSIRWLQRTPCSGCLPRKTGKVDLVALAMLTGDQRGRVRVLRMWDWTLQMTPSCPPNDLSSALAVPRYLSLISPSTRQMRTTIVSCFELPCCGMSALRRQIPAVNVLTRSSPPRVKDKKYKTREFASRGLSFRERNPPALSDPKRDALVIGQPVHNINLGVEALINTK